ncbi:F-box/LRR protein, putative [Medicago truncatula]|uniref:F-box/LRR protein, putative n=1 Tax=Medicago truncatula TaxID=3880 RepID=A0A072U696_MEDTR|nr:F-box/LRR protein, putative [Medicago truncatula]
MQSASPPSTSRTTAITSTGYWEKHISEGICHVLRRCFNIRHLNFTGCSRVKLLGINFLVTQLEVLNLSDTKVDDETLYVISKSCSALLELLLKGCENVTEKGLKHVSLYKYLNYTCIHENGEGLDAGSSDGNHQKRDSTQVSTLRNSTLCSGASDEFLCVKCFTDFSSTGDFIDLLSSNELLYVLLASRIVGYVDIFEMNFVLPKLEVLDLSKTDVHDETLCAISKICPRLLELSLIGCDWVTERSERCGAKLQTTDKD